MDRPNNLPSRSPLGAYRNPDTPVEDSVRQRRETGENCSPAAAVLTQLAQSSSFFTQDDRARVWMTTRMTANKNNTLVRINPPTDLTGRMDSGSFPAAPVVPVTALTGPHFASLRVASLDETRIVHHRLVLRAPIGFDVLLYHHPMEVYVAWGLHVTRHVYENRGPLQEWPPRLDDLSSGRLILSDTRPKESCPNTIMVVRPGSHIYDISFPPETFQIPIEKLFQFVVRRFVERWCFWKIRMAHWSVPFSGDWSTVYAGRVNLSAEK